jgi:hypothetical protein
MNIKLTLFCKSQLNLQIYKQCKKKKITCPIGQVHLDIDLSNHKMDWTRTIGQTLMLSSGTTLHHVHSEIQCILPDSNICKVRGTHGP